MNTKQGTAPVSPGEYYPPPSSDALAHYRNLLKFPINIAADPPLDQWVNRLYKSVLLSATLGQLVHLPFYCPFLCLLQESLPFHHSIGVEHRFEFRHPTSGSPIAIIHFIISPSYHHTQAQWCYSQDPHYEVPSCQN